jgi:RNA-directed DNA polymerase
MQALCFANGTKTQTDWQSIDWKKANRIVRNLRQRIFRATQHGDWKTVRSLQKLMLRSRSNILVSVRRVTQVNQGRKTPGVDKVVVKTPAARGKLVDELAAFTPWRAKPVRRIYIPKNNGPHIRPLGIPVVKDRCLQAMVKNALEPSWEARFEGSSYGFRPGRGCHDAIGKIYSLARPDKTKKWVLDADIKGAFNEISHGHLLETLGPVPGRALIRQWLKAGYIDEGIFYDTEAGTPQGGVISPVLMNVALHGIEEALGVTRRSDGTLRSKRAIVRYADDFVVFCETQADAYQAQHILTEWLNPRGLTLSEEKTRVVHLTEGFDFLGFNVRHYPMPHTTRTGWKLLIKPSRKSIQKLRDKLKAEWLKLHGHDAATVTRKLNPIIRGWANYFRVGVSSHAFATLDHWMTQRAMRYARRAHPTKPKHWWTRRYFGRLNPSRQDTWVFGDKHTGAYLLKFGWFPIERHILVKGRASPDDPSLKAYWLARGKAKAKALTPSKRKLADRQNGLCPQCGDSLFNDEEIEQHHIVPKQEGGPNTYDNLALVHFFCHQQLTAQG